VAGTETRVRRPALGFAMVFGAATLFGLNGSVAKVALASGLSSLRLTEARCAGPAIALMLFLLVRSPHALRVDRRDLLRLAVFGVVGVALVQLFYFLAIHRLQIGIALLIQYLGPLLVAIWARTVGHEQVRANLGGACVQPSWSFPAHRVGQTVSREGRLAAWHLPVWALVL
jgi:drug/metabolite transporter (DMT)-like permease